MSINVLIGGWSVVCAAAVLGVTGLRYGRGVSVLALPFLDDKKSLFEIAVSVFVGSFGIWAAGCLLIFLVHRYAPELPRALAAVSRSFKRRFSRWSLNGLFDRFKRRSEDPKFESVVLMCPGENCGKWFRVPKQPSAIRVKCPNPDCSLFLIVKDGKIISVKDSEQYSKA